MLLSRSSTESCAPHTQCSACNTCLGVTEAMQVQALRTSATSAQLAPRHRSFQPALRALAEDRPDPRSFNHANVSMQLGFDPLAAAATQPMLQQRERQKLDMQPDAAFYTQPCSAHHTDQHFRTLLEQLYARTLQPGWRVLDLCSSVHSHLPASVSLSSVTGLGLNAQELNLNPALTERVFHDLNLSPMVLPFEAGAFDALLCCCGLPYLEQPEVVAAEARRVLRPGGAVVLSFSMHCYSEKAIIGWLERSSQQRVQLVVRLLQQARFQDVQVSVCNVASAQLQPDRPGQEALVTVPTTLIDTWEELPADVAAPHQPQCALTADAFFAVTAKAPRAVDAAGAGSTMQAGSGSQWQPASPATLAAAYIAPALREMELLDTTAGTAIAAPAAAAAGVGSTGGKNQQQFDQSQGSRLGQAQEGQGMSHDGHISEQVLQISDETLERWLAAYAEMSSDAQQLGIPREAIPQLPWNCRDVQCIRDARDHLQAMIASFLSAGL